MAQRRLRVQDYTVGWVCALPIELAAATKMLDEEHQGLPRDDNDTNLYTFGRIGEHNVVIACLPAGETGPSSAAAVAVEMKSTFAQIRFGLMVGIGGGVPRAGSDIRLGDVVISFLNTPPTLLLSALTKLQANHDIGRNDILTHLSAVSDLLKFTRNNAGPDILFKSDYEHIEGPTCAQCSKDNLVERAQRTGQEIVVHYGTIASGNLVIRDGLTRDRLSSELDGVLCFEMEAAGLMNKFPCLVIRDICDYADSHKNKTWQPYAAATAAACAKELLSVIPSAEVIKTRTMNEALNGKDGPTDLTLPISPILPRITGRPKWGTLVSKTKIPANDIFERLSDYDYQRAYKWRRNRRLENTTNWILKHPLFLAWLRGEEPQCLWLSGIVGCGKSIIMTTVIDTTIAEAQSVGRPVLQFIYDHSFRRYLSARALFESYTKQLLVYIQQSNKYYPSAVITRIQEFYGPNRCRPDVQELLVDILIPLYQMVEATGATFLVDGVDECSRQEILEILWGLRQLLGLHLCKVFICCRNEVNVLRGIPGANHIWITAKDTKADLEVFVNKEIERMQYDRPISSNEAVLKSIRHEVLSKASGMFLWVQYLIKMIWEDCTGEESTDKAVYETLKKLPPDLNATYQHCLAKVNQDSKRKSLADRILRWICVSPEPFKIIQLQEALALNSDTGELGEGQINKEEIIACCASLVFLEKDDPDELVLLAHHSVRQFQFRLGGESAALVELGELCVIHLYRNPPVKELINYTKSSSDPIGTTIPIPRSYGSIINSIIAPSIFNSRLLSSRSRHQKPVSLQFPQPASQNIISQNTDFLSYAKINWMVLTLNLPHTSRHWSAFKNLALPNDRSWDIYPWQQGGYRSIDWHVSQLYGWSIINSHYPLLSLAIGQRGIVKHDIFNLPLFDHAARQALLPLHAAAATGDTRIVGLLLEIMPGVNEQYSYALHAASSKGHLEVVQLLLKAGANVNARAGNLDNALQAAWYQGHYQVVQSLLDAGADLNVLTLKGHTGSVRAVAFSPDGQLVASASGDGTVRLWDAKTGAAHRTLKGHMIWVEAVAFSPDGQLVASASTDHTVRLWDAKIGAAHRTLEGHTSRVGAVAFSSDGQLVASALGDHTVRLWIPL